MEHYNPLLKDTKMGKKFITIGEVMLRLTPPNYEKIRMATTFEASYGGAEANIALALANLGVDSTFFSVVPNNSIGKSAVRMLRSNDVHCTPMILSTPEETPTHRLGTYYLETGYGIRPSKVTYDRKHSAITEYDLTKVDVEQLLDGFDWLHLSGITPALCKSCADFIMVCLKVAKEKASEIVYYGECDGISTGASGDLVSATRTAHSIVCTYGMDDEFGLAVQGGEISPEARVAINRILREQMDEAVRLVSANKDKIDSLVSELLNKNHLNCEEIKKILS